MEKRTNYLWVILIVAILVVATVFYLKKKKAAQQSTGGGGGSNKQGDNMALPETKEASTDKNPVKTVEKTTAGFPLQYGSKGEEVKKLQEALNGKGAKLKVDGDFGPATSSALRNLNLPIVVDEAKYKELTQSTADKALSVAIRMASPLNVITALWKSVTS